MLGLIPEIWSPNVCLKLLFSVVEKWLFTTVTLYRWSIQVNSVLVSSFFSKLCSKSYQNWVVSLSYLKIKRRLRGDVFRETRYYRFRHFRRNLYKKHYANFPYLLYFIPPLRVFRSFVTLFRLKEKLWPQHRVKSLTIYTAVGTVSTRHHNRTHTHRRTDRRTDGRIEIPHQYRVSAYRHTDIEHLTIPAIFGNNGTKYSIAWVNYCCNLNSTVIDGYSNQASVIAIHNFTNDKTALG